MGGKEPFEETTAFVVLLAVFIAAMAAWGAFWLWVGVWGWSWL
jgi:hypothetical protein